MVLKHNCMILIIATLKSLKYPLLRLETMMLIFVYSGEPNLCVGYVVQARSFDTSWLFVLMLIMNSVGLKTLFKPVLRKIYLGGKLYDDLL